MPIVTRPAPGGSQKQSDKVFQWNMQGVYHINSKVTVGVPWPLVENFYQGTVKAAGIYEDRAVNHPGGNKQCGTWPKYQKQTNGGWYTDGSIPTSFTSTTG